MHHFLAFAMRFTLLLLLAAFMMGMTASTEFRLRSFTAQLSPDNKTTVLLTWAVDHDLEVDEYILLRKFEGQNTPKEFVRVKVENGPAQNKKYTHTDGALYKSMDSSGSEVVYYLKYTLKSNGQVIEPQNNEAKLNYTSTTMRRTWGSIKAMFQ